MSMSISLQKSSTRTNVKHNNRTMSEKEQERNPHIDQSRSSENKYLVQEDLKELYEREFGGALEKYNAKQKRHDRKIKDYYKHIESGKKTSVQQEMIIQVGDKDDFSSDEKRELANEVLQDWFKGFEERNPNLKVYNAVIHNDEASPHLHMNFVPVAGEYKNGLEKQVSFDRAIIQQDSTLQKQRPFDHWREKEVQLLEEKLNERGIERKLVGKNNYKDVNEYKEKKDLQKEIQLLEKNIVGKKKELIDLTEVLPQGNLDVKIRPEMKTIVKQKWLGDAEITKKDTGNHVLTTKQLKDLTGYVNAALAVKKDYERLQSTDLVQENKGLHREIDSLRGHLGELQKENQNLISKNKTLKSDISNLKDRIEALTIEVSSAYKGIKEYIKEHTKDVRGFKNAFKDVVDIVKGKSRQERDASGFTSPEGEFEKTYKREMARERNRGFER